MQDAALLLAGVLCLILTLVQASTSNNVPKLHYSTGRSSVMDLFPIQCAFSFAVFPGQAPEPS